MTDWELYEKGKEYNARLNYNIEVDKNWRFYNLKHLDSFSSKGMPKVRMPMSRRIVDQAVATCMTKAVKMNYVIQNLMGEEGEQEKVLLSQHLSQHSQDQWETLTMDSLIRSVLYDGAMSGDFDAHIYWDATYDTGQTNGEREVFDEQGNPVFDEMGNLKTEPVPILGDFWTEPIDGVNVYLGNPNDKRINFHGRPHQPYVIVAGRDTVLNLRGEAKEYSKAQNGHEKQNKLTAEDIEKICPDSDNLEQAGDKGKVELDLSNEYGMATYIIKYWHKNGKIYFNKSTKGCVIREKVDSGLTIYPVAHGNWGTVKNSYHGQSLMSCLTDNQLELDRFWMALLKYAKDMAFPKAIANKSYFPDGKLTNKIGDVIWYDGMESVSPSNVLSYTQPAQLANRLIDLLEIFRKTVMELMGAGDSVLGNANPENTSAIVANVQNSIIPLETVKANLYQFIEDIGYIWLDFQLHKYNIPRYIAIDNNGQREMVLFDPSKLSKAKFRIKVDVISGSYIDEFTAMRTMENLFLQKQIDVIQFIERLPDGMIPEKEKLMSELNAKIQAEQNFQRELMSQEHDAKVIQDFMKQVEGKVNTEQPAM